MKNAKTLTAGAVLGGSLLFTAGLGMAMAQPDTAADNRVNVSIGNAGVLQDVDVTASAQIAADVCHTDVSSVTALAQAADTEGTEKTVCTNNLGTVAIQQNGPGHSENAPGQAEQREATPTSEAPTTSPTAPTAENGAS
ncbi:hypothetical protein AU184_07015 [Mycolicibacterium novocastrense]|uniref:hypothetical protein n=1 Tax=Mycolicibacterium novocastrense TaxID=59813 RepID=UPI0007479A60|nr:hypothetical protein [Mycolicibacterium novocastrense]KUH73615.1 hypothetical protein AU183_24935 [Mycolicibacterium novocastrense]KUH74707.1 hypothetical protein AU072_12005 [Mycolicibacterium novocastrense]KUH76021.1 hypothetical protein AU184_07015 [Mycolicibacterium novocastrense]